MTDLSSRHRHRNRSNGTGTAVAVGALGLFLAFSTGCGKGPLPPAAPTTKAGPPSFAAPSDSRERHFAGIEQLTFGGENAEAYWSWSGNELVFQAHSGSGCDQIYRMPVFPSAGELVQISRGGANTCAFFFPGDESVLYSSTLLAGAECPPKPDRSQGYVWPIYPSYDIFRARADGSDAARLTETPGYDAEATVCSRDGSIVFTSVRDGDLELYRMDANGKNVVRLTNAPGYDGGAFFNADCSMLVWRASRPTGEALADYRRLLGQGLVRPGKLELWVANGDGSDARQVTSLGAAAFAPYFHPSGKRVLFSTNFHVPGGREFDIWAVDVDGTRLERITYAPGFDGFPMFSPDGKYLAFSSNRASAPGTYETNVFVAQWNDAAVEPTVVTAADRIGADAAWLADPAREGRGVGTEGLDAAGAYLEKRFAEIGLKPAGTQGYRQPLEVVTSVRVLPETRLAIDGKALPKEAYQPLVMSSEGEVTADTVAVGYGIVDAERKIDDYAGADVRGKIAVVRRFVPESEAFAGIDDKRRFGDLYEKAWLARERGAKALLVVDAPAVPKGSGKDWKPPDEAAFPSLSRRGYGDAGIPVVIVKRDVGAALFARRARLSFNVKLGLEQQKVFNVAGRLEAGGTPKQPQPLVLGAHYDHLGFGGFGSLAPDSKQPHLGADDNASGTAALLEVARALAEQRGGLRRDVVFVAFTAEEMGLLGSTHFTREPPPGIDMAQIYAMLNLDMVGRLRENRLVVLGSQTAAEWDALLEPVCQKSGLECRTSGDGFGPSDQTSFYASGVPVLHFFTGAHSDYHKPSDSVDRLNLTGAAAVSAIVSGVLTELSRREAPLTFQKVTPVAPGGDLRSFNASLGTIPDYAGPKSGKGVLLAGVRTGGAAEQGGLTRGDVLISLGPHSIDNVEALMYALNALEPGQRVIAVVLRDGKRLELPVALQETGRGH